MISPACFLICDECGSTTVVVGEYLLDHDEDPPARVIIPKALPLKWKAKPKFPGLSSFPDPFGDNHYCPDSSCQEAVS